MRSAGSQVFEFLCSVRCSRAVASDVDEVPQHWVCRKLPELVALHTSHSRVLVSSRRACVMWLR